MVCGCCGGTIAQVSGNSGGCYGCLAATKGACENRTLVHRTRAEKVILDAIKTRISEPEHIACVIQRVEEEIAKLRSDLPHTLKLKKAELSAEQRRMANFADFIGEGPGSQALAKALVETERRVESQALRNILGPSSRRCLGSEPLTGDSLLAGGSGSHIHDPAASVIRVALDAGGQTSA